MIELRNLRGGYQGAEKVRGVNLVFEPGSITTLIGPNGCGKSTLLLMASGLLEPYGGEVLLRGRNMAQIPRRELARQVSYLPQSRNVFQITVRKLVMHGRFPYLDYPRRYGREDRAIAEEAIARVGMTALADKSLAELSGGERQKAYLAMILAQDTGAVILDEPTTYLDIAHQFEIMDLAERLKGAGKTVVMVLHDLNLAMRHSDRVAVMSGGVIQKTGTPGAVYGSGVLRAVFGVDVTAQATEAAGVQYCCAPLTRGAE